MRRAHVRTLVIAVAALPIWAAVANGCSAGNDANSSVQGFGGDGNATGSSKGGNGGSAPTTSATGGSGGTIIIPDGGGGKDATGDVKNPCGSQCGATELCDPDHLGIDDNCNYAVDEGCPCTAGQAHFCFKGDPSYRGTAGCFDGVERCSENGTWGPCAGGVHATPEDQCWLNNTTGCHAIQTAPFVDIDLKTGTGNFSSNAVTETWTVACPAGVSPCPTPGPAPPSTYKPLQSGEYAVTYQKVTGDGGVETCNYPLFVGAPGLRVELSWEHPAGTACDPSGSGDECPSFECLPSGFCSNAVDLDLHVHKPADTGNWNMQGSSKVDCTWANCAIGEFGTLFSPTWFADTGMPPDPLNWWLDPVMEKNTCYYDPRGVGQEWQNKHKGCHNPRLDLDDIECDPSVTDPNDDEFCAPENINIDFPPPAQWTRVGVYYYSNNGNDTYDVHPEIRIYCNGSLAAQLGSTADPNDPTMRLTSGYDSPVTFTPGQGGTVFWEVADVIFPDNQCSNSICTVQPLYADQTLKTPVFAHGENGVPIGPAYPPIP